MSASRLLVEYDDDLKRSKVTIFIRRKWGLLALYSGALFVWVTMLVGFIGYLLGGYSSSIVITILLLIWLVIWFGFGWILWKRWQFQAAAREILFIDQEKLILRRPVSILGITTAYDMIHVSPLYYSEQHRCPAFDYAYLHVYFGRDLEPAVSEELIGDINNRWFPDVELLS